MTSSSEALKSVRSDVQWAVFDCAQKGVADVTRRAMQRFGFGSHLFYRNTVQSSRRVMKLARSMDAELARMLSVNPRYVRQCVE